MAHVWHNVSIWYIATIVTSYVYGDVKYGTRMASMARIWHSMVRMARLWHKYGKYGTNMAQVWHNVSHDLYGTA